MVKNRRKPGRPPKPAGTLLTVPKHFYLTEEEAERLRQAAELSQEPESVLIRRLIREYASEVLR